MPWCPKCKNEYRAGIKVCADCGCELVEESQTLTKPLIFGEEEQMRSLKKFLEYNQLKDVDLKLDEREGLYELFVPERDFQKANAMKKVFLEQEAVRKKEEQKSKMVWDNRDEDTAETEVFGGASLEQTLYMDSKTRAKDSRSTAGILLLVGGAGLFVIILCMTGILKFKFEYSDLFFDMMAIAFFLVVVMGAMSVQKAQVFSQKAKSEDTLRNTILRWCAENLSAEKIDAAADAGEGTELADGALYFRRTEQLKKQINHQFMNLDQEFLEHFIDEQVYEAVYGENGK